MPQDASTPSPLTLCFFRHGQTDWNVAQKFQGHLDIPLNATGMSQARELAAKCTALRDRFEMSHIYSSDLARAYETARAVASELDIEISTTPELREAFMGDAQGKTRDELLKIVDQEFIALWMGDPAHPAAKDLRFQGGESRGEMVARVLKLIEAWKQEHAGETLGVSSHGGVLRHVLGTLLVDEHDAFARVPNVALFVVRWHPDRARWELLHSP